MSSLRKGIQGVLGGELSFRQATLEAFRRGRAKVVAQRERASLHDLATRPAQLKPEFQNLAASQLLEHFRSRTSPSFLPGFTDLKVTAARQKELCASETERLVESAQRIVKEHRWPLLGFGEKDFGSEINWHRDPLSGRIWPLDYHADIALWHNDGSDVRVLWELNRLGHLITLAQAYALSGEEAFARECLLQLESWREQNPVARGANWACAMEVALRAMNLLAALSLIRNSPEFTEERWLDLLSLFEQHAEHIRRNLEFSYVATGNHYLSDVVGLLWIAIMLPELNSANEWREWAMAEMLQEMDKQTLPDGADYEGSIGYHCFVLELLLYTFILCRVNQIATADAYWRKLHAMLEYLQTVVRPDGMIPLVGDTDSGRVLPFRERSGNDRSYLLSLGAAVFAESQFKHAGLDIPSDLIWILGDEGVRTHKELATRNERARTQDFADAGTYVFRHEDLYLLFNATGSRNGRPTSHRHNDILSLEVSAGGRAFIVDPGTYVYTADLHERQLFRSTSYHSTIQIDDEEQQTIFEDAPFATGNEARAKVLQWSSTPEHDRVVAEHTGYDRLAEPVKHRRAVTLNKRDRYWLIEDELFGQGEHDITARFHFDAGLTVIIEQNYVTARDDETGVRLVICAIEPGLGGLPQLESQFVSKHYGSKLPSTTACWSTRSSVPVSFRWAVIPVAAHEELNKRLALLEASTLDVGL